jgi:hypothetical protein
LVRIASHLFFVFFLAALVALAFFFSGVTDRCSSNIRCRAAALPPGGAGVLSPGRFMVSSLASSIWNSIAQSEAHPAAMAIARLKIAE